MEEGDQSQGSDHPGLRVHPSESGADSDRTLTPVRAERGARGVQPPTTTPTSRLFADPDPGAIFNRISSGDPLRIYELGARRLRERFVFVDADRLYELALAHVATIAALEQRRDADESWLRSVMDRAIDSILTEDSEEQRAHPPLNDRDDRRYYHLGLSLGVEPELARSAVVNFNAMPERARRGFFLLLIENRSVADTLAEGYWPKPEDLRYDIWDGLRALGHLRPGETLGKRRRRRE
jgi:hypothetical protein